MRRTRYASLAEHPHVTELTAVRERIPTLSDGELGALADRWVNTAATARARSRALGPGTPLIIDILRLFDDIAQLFADDLDGDGSLDPRVVNRALKAVRDNVAGIVARPALSRRDAGLLEGPWRSATDNRPAPPIPTIARVEDLLAAACQLVNRCHDPRAAEAFDRILVGAMTRDHAEHGAAVGAALVAAGQLRRHRSWSLLRVNAERGIGARCRWCPPAAWFDDYDRERVITLCADAACALLVADVLPARTLDVLLGPLAGLVPFPRDPLDA